MNTFMAPMSKWARFFLLRLKLEIIFCASLKMLRKAINDDFCSHARPLQNAFWLVVKWHLRMRVVNQV